MRSTSEREVVVRTGANLRRARKAAGIRQEALGFRASLHRTAVGLLERGERMPQLDTATKLAGALGVPIGALVDGIEWENGDELAPGRFHLGAEADWKNPPSKPPPHSGSGARTADDVRELAKRFGANLVRARRAAGLSQKQVSIRADLHRSEISLLELGERMPRLETVVKLAAATGAGVEELVDGIAWTPVPDPQEGSFTVAPRGAGEGIRGV